MAKRAKSKTGGKAEVETYKHKEAKRKNIPTAENQKLIADDDKAVKILRWPRNPDLDPQLVWRGKDVEPDPLEVDAPPIYIQEKIKPQAIIEDLRRQTKERTKDSASQFDFFHDFNGLPEGWKEDATQSYYHDEGNWSNRMILGDSLLVMASLAEREGLRGKVQCIYMDPPYGIRFNSNWQPTTKSKDVKDASPNSLSREPEVIRAFRDTWKEQIHSYLSYLRDRLVVARDLLHESGSLFLQIGDENIHLVRSVLDEVFGSKNFVSLITFAKTTGLEATSRISSAFDFIVWYAKNAETVKYHPIFRERSEASASRFGLVQLLDGSAVVASEAEIADLEEKGEWHRIFTDTDLTKPGPGAKYEFRYNGHAFDSENRWWGTQKESLERIAKAHRLFITGRNRLRFVRAEDDSAVQGLTNAWIDVGGAVQSRSDPKIYVVQTATAVVARCILMTSDPGDLILDPTCGSGTAAYAAEQWGRRWITIDTSRVALTLARGRLMGARYDYYLLRDSHLGAEKEGEITGKPPVTSLFANNIRHGFVYERAPHVMLKTIADDAEIDVIWDRWQKTLEPLREKLSEVSGQWSGAGGQRRPIEEWEIPRERPDHWPPTTDHLLTQIWQARRARQKEIDDSIARNAEVEYLYDRPYKARGVVRVAGPFTVESLSPHRVLPMGEDPYLEEILGAAEGEDDPSPLVGEGREGSREAGHNGGRVQSLPSSPARRLATPTPDPSPQGGGEKSGMVTTDFAQVVYDNLKAAGVQNTRKGETLEFEWVKPFASRSGLIQFEGRYQEKGASKRAAVCIGPEYDTVGYDLVRTAAKEAADLFDTLIVCGFAFAPEVDDTRLTFGQLTVLKARMNQDLRMADKLKATGAGNLFVVFGEPDIVIHKLKDDMLKVEIRGMDIFDPTTGEVRSSGGKDLMNDVAAWFIDNDYDEESFFVRQAYFVGDDPYDGLKRALKAEIDETAWGRVEFNRIAPVPSPRTRPHLRQGDQPLRRRGAEGLSGLNGEVAQNAFGNPA